MSFIVSEGCLFFGAVFIVMLLAFNLGLQATLSLGKVGQLNYEMHILLTDNLWKGRRGEVVSLKRRVRSILAFKHIIL